MAEVEKAVPVDNEPVADPVAGGGEAANEAITKGPPIGTTPKDVTKETAPVGEGGEVTYDTKVTNGGETVGETEPTTPSEGPDPLIGLRFQIVKFNRGSSILVCGGDRFWFKTNQWVAYVQIVLMVGMFLPAVNAISMVFKIVLMYYGLIFLIQDLDRAGARNNDQTGLIGLLLFFSTGFLFGGDRLFFGTKAWISNIQFSLSFGMFFPFVNLVVMAIKGILMIVQLVQLLKDLEAHPINKK